MCLGSSPSAPDPTGAGGGVSDADRRRRAAAAGGSSTILTGSRGVTDSGATQTKTLLGA